MLRLYRLIPIALALSLAAPIAFAEEPKPLHVCLWPCAGPATSSLAPGAVELSPVLYLRPSLDLQVVVRDGLERKWSFGLEPGVGYGIAWDPIGLQLARKRNPGAPLPPEALAFDVRASVGLKDSTVRARLVGMLTVGGMLTFGVGLDAALGSGPVGDQYGLAVVAGWRYTL